MYNELYSPVYKEINLNTRTCEACLLDVLNFNFAKLSRWNSHFKSLNARLNNEPDIFLVQR